MVLTITSCTPQREPGFSSSECLELAAKLRDVDIMTGTFPPTNGEDIEEGLSNHERDLIVAALRAYANV